MRHSQLSHEFVRNIPEYVQPGVLYVSMEYGMVSHSCCCGCGEEVTTPLTPTDWKLTFDGEAISLHPSVGNWNLPCRSHYVISRGKVIPSGDWSDEQVEAERKRDRAAKARHYGVTPRHEVDETAEQGRADHKLDVSTRAGWFQRLFSRRRNGAG